MLDCSIALTNRSERAKPCSGEVLANNAIKDLQYNGPILRLLYSTVQYVNSFANERTPMSLPTRAIRFALTPWLPICGTAAAQRSALRCHCYVIPATPPFTDHPAAHRYAFLIIERLHWKQVPSNMSKNWTGRLSIVL